MPAGRSPSDDQSFTVLYREAAPALHVWATLRVHPQLRGFCEVSDLLQEVWCRAFAIRDRFDPERTPFRPWIFRVAKNVMLEVLREARRVARLGRSSDGHTSRLLRLEGVADEVTSITRRVARDETLRAFRERIETLSSDERDLVLHLGLEGMSQSDVATRLGLSTEAVKKRWQRLRARLDVSGLPATLLESSQ